MLRIWLDNLGYESPESRKRRRLHKMRDPAFRKMVNRRSRVSRRKTIKIRFKAFALDVEYFCAYCLRSDVKLQWAHRREEKKRWTVLEAVLRGSVKSALEEMHKCVRLCWMCHKVYDGMIKDVDIPKRYLVQTKK